MQIKNYEMHFQNYSKHIYNFIKIQNDEQYFFERIYQANNFCKEANKIK